MIAAYDWAGGQEAMLRFGPDTGPVVVLLLPLFEEANRTRTFAVGLLRRLAQQGMGSALPDIPGMGESLVPTYRTTLKAMRDALDAITAHIGAENRRTYIATIRSGALLDGTPLAAGHWHFAPSTGAELLRDLTRTAQAATRESGAQFDPGSDPIEIAGNLLSPTLWHELEAPPSGISHRLRTVRLETDPKPADHKVMGTPLWRRAEPGDDPALADLLAADIIAWVRSCED